MANENTKKETFREKLGKKIDKIVESGALKPLIRATVIVGTILVTHKVVDATFRYGQAVGASNVLSSIQSVCKATGKPYVLNNNDGVPALVIDIAKTES